MSRIVLCPGFVISKSDHDVHYVTASQLAQLYGVPAGQYIVWDVVAQPQFRPAPTDVLLYPQFDGNYTLPAAAKELLK